MRRVAVFGGTVEGRVCAEALAGGGASVTAFVATAYGAESIQPRPGLSVREGRLDQRKMGEIFRAGQFDAILDATHPYAASVTENLAAAARETDVFYLRVARAESDYETGRADIIPAANAEEAAEILNLVSGRILLTTGSKEIEAFTRVANWRKRVFARVLPALEVMQKCADMGFQSRNLICMQGPFTHDINMAMIRMLGIDVLVSKDSGGAGGFPEKVSAARACGIKLIVIRRPPEDGANSAVSAKEALDTLRARFGGMDTVESRETQTKTDEVRETRTETAEAREIKEESAGRAPRPKFPLFISLEAKNVLIIGGGEVAARRARRLLDFGALITVISPEISRAAQELLGHIIWKAEQYSGIHEDFALVIAATNDRSVNRQAGEDAKQRGIPVSIADSGAESTCWFPAIARGSDIVCGIVSENGNHSAVKMAAEKIRKSLAEGI